MSDGDRIQSMETAFALLDYLATTGGAGASELSDAIDLSRTGVYKHLRTLESLRAVENEGGTYVLGPKFAEYTVSGRQETSLFVDDTGAIDDLAVSLDAPTNLWSPEGRRCVCVYTTLPNEGRENPRRREESLLMVDSTPGKTMLAYAAERTRTGLLEQYDGPEDVDDIEEQLQSVRERDLLIESLAPRNDWFSIASPIVDSTGDPQGAVEVVIPTERAKGINVEVNIAGLLLDTVNRLEGRL